LKKKVIVIGGGAAGLFAAGEVATNGAEVVILEKMEKVGRKIRITGKGRCNLTNIAPIKDFLTHISPDNGRFVRQAFSYFFAPELTDFFNELGVKTITERGGRVFPASEKAPDIANALYNWNKQMGVKIILNARVQSLIIEENTAKGVVYVIKGDSEKYKIIGDKVIIATGGASYPATGSNGDGYNFAKKAGHTIITPLPSLVPLEIAGDFPEKLQGLSLRNVNATLWVNGKKTEEKFGEMLFTHFGLSGPIILSLSRTAVLEINKKNKVEISIDFKPALDFQKLDRRLLRDIDIHGKRQVKAMLRQLLPAKMIPVFMEILNLDGEKPSHQINSKERKALKNLLKNFRMEITGYRPFKEAIITSGGISTKEINPKTMESRIIKNLYFVGEILDVDAETGGYNLQIAFSTGKLAGKFCISEK